MGSKRASIILSPPISPSPSSIPRPNSSVGSVRPRQSSDASTLMGETPDTRNVRVVLRLRPSDPNDSSIPPRFRNVLVHPTSPSEVRLDVDPSALAGQAVGTSHTAGNKKHPLFNFDHVLGEQATQTELYDVTARETVDEFIKGHNVTFLAYGQTSSGKSYSMGTTGEEVDYSGTEFTPRTGLIPRTVHTIFEKAEEIRQLSGPGASWECRLSFLELYNEEIIDLLSGTGVAIQIREERDGRIVWAGVREVKVKSLEEVMYLLQQGSERRKTGETSMNATSSRSHAIFSLTLIQKKRSGLSSPISGIPRSETPTRQLRRPSSTIGLPGPRSPTPSSARGGPPSSFGRATPSRPLSMQPPPSPNASNEFVITTSKFNMVDLAGSERLKRTAAQGDRMKEGISINSGLLALGNVISTLCDPVKARGHIPYRDSKLTRMLQDSIGGNSLTTMIACISPIEANIGETINTIKYASRARNIRNQAKINQVEAGWDDVEHLQSTVMKLRKQLAMLSEDGKSSISNGHSPAASEGSIKQSEKLIQRLAELQKEHTELYDRYLQKCSENMRLSSDLRSREPVDSDASNKFNEMVEPVILEYEKVVSALNQQLDELRGELSAMSEMQDDQNRQLQEARDRQTQSEAYVSELRSRLAKLTERNTSSEAYIQDLEAKLKVFEEKEDSHSEAIGELKKDIAKLRDNNATLNQHTSELEIRLSKSETLSGNLAAQLEKQEKEAERREAAYRDLEAHIALLDTTKDNKLLLEELDQRDQKIAELEQELEEKAASEEKERSQLMDAVQTEKSIQAELRSRLASMQASSASATTRSNSPNPQHEEETTAIVNLPRNAPRSTEQLTPPETPQQSVPNHNKDNQDEVEELKKALVELAEKYRNTESKVVELTMQLSEAKLVNAEAEDVVPPSPSPGTEDEEETLSEAETTLQTPRDSMSSTSPSRRRGSMPILSATKGQAGQGPGFRVGRGYGDSTRMRPQSLSQELSSAQSLGTSPRSSWTSIQSHSRNNSLLLSSPSPTNSIHTLKPSRSSQSLQAELKFVHRIVEERDEELKDREAYIRQLEQNLQNQNKTHIIPSLMPSAPITENQYPIPVPTTPVRTPKINISDTPPRNIPLPDSPKTPLAPIVSLPNDVTPQKNHRSTAIDGLKVPDHGEVEMGGLSPKSVKRFSQLKDTLSQLENGGSEKTEAQVKIDELMKEMVDKEESQKKIIEQQFIQIADLQKMNNKLKEELTEKELATPSTAQIEELRRERDQLISEKAQIFPHVPSISSSPRTPAIDIVAMDRLKAEHAEDLRSLIQGHKDTVTVLQAEHVHAFGKLRNTIEANENSHRAELESLQSKHDIIIADLQSRHNETLEAVQAENNLIAEEMERSLSESEEERRQLKMKADQAFFELSRIRDEHALQRNSDVKSIAELTKSCNTLEEIRDELEASISELKNSNTDLNKKVSELETKLSRKSVIPPPQGPPPTTPLPPLPKKRSMGNMKPEPSSSSPTSLSGFNRDREGSGEYFARASTSSNGHNSTASHGGLEGSTVSVDKEQISRLINEKDLIVGEKEELLGEKQDLQKEMKDVKRKVQDVENKLMEEKVKVTNLTFDLRESQKQNTKLRTHLEESKREVKQLTDTCNIHITELNARREEANRFSEEGHKSRDSLQAAQAQVESLKRQLDKAVEKKVNKKLLGCF